MSPPSVGLPASLPVCQAAPGRERRSKLHFEASELRYLALWWREEVEEVCMQAKSYTADWLAGWLAYEV